MTRTAINEPSTSDACPDLPSDVGDLIARRLERVVQEIHPPDNLPQLSPGKMLRTRLAWRLAQAGASPLPLATLVNCCAAVEMVHTASLCHDDVIDNALIRRNLPSLWKVTGPSGAVLVGDVLMCEAVDLIMLADADGSILPAFIAKVREMCLAEAEHELSLRGRELESAQCIRMARRKTGSLFAFVALVCGGGDSAVRAALEEAGYHLGTAYQLADDLLDTVGDERALGKTLGTDALKSKFTVAQAGDQRLCRQLVIDFCAKAVAAVANWPAARQGVNDFLRLDVGPVLGLVGCQE